MHDDGIAKRFWTNVDTTAGPDSCWPWTASLMGWGYGQMSVGGKPQRANRLAWELTHGPILNSLCVLHACDNPSCCNPAHLFLGTSADNMADMARKERSRSTKLTAAQVVQIRLDADSGSPHALLALRYGVSRPAISYAVRRDTWKHVP
jgi:hypothetical protein